MPNKFSGLTLFLGQILYLGQQPCFKTRAEIHQALLSQFSLLAEFFWIFPYNTKIVGFYLSKSDTCPFIFTLKLL